MRHDSGELGFVIGRENQAAINEKESARKSERIYLVAVDDLDRERDLCVGMQNDILADTVYVFGNDGILDQLACCSISERADGRGRSLFL